MASSHAWILQTDPALYDITGALRHGRCRIEWQISHHKKAVAVGDRVFIWRAGPQPGIVAAGYIATPLRRTTVPSADASHYCDYAAQIEAVTQPEDRAGVEVAAVGFLPKAQLAALDQFGSHHLLRVAAGTIFSLTPAQAEELAALVAEDAPPLPPTQDVEDSGAEVPAATAPESVQSLAVRARKLREEAEDLTREDAKAALIAPMLDLLGWDTEDVHTVRHDWRRTTRGNPIDYALMLFGEERPVMLIEAHPLGRAIAHGTISGQAIGYAASAGVPFIAVTDGDHWFLYATGAASEDERLIAAVSLADDPEGTWDVLREIARDQAPFAALGQRWHRDRATAAVHAVLDGALAGAEPARWLTQAVQRQVGEEFSVADVAHAMRRVGLRIDSPR